MTAFEIDSSVAGRPGWGANLPTEAKAGYVCFSPF